MFRPTLADDDGLGGITILNIVSTDRLRRVIVFRQGPGFFGNVIPPSNRCRVIFFGRSPVSSISDWIEAGPRIGDSGAGSFQYVN